MAAQRTVCSTDVRRFGAMVLATRKFKGLSQTTLARLSGVTQSTISALEIGVIDDLSLSRVAKLIRALDLDPCAVFQTEERRRAA